MEQAEDTSPYPSRDISDFQVQIIPKVTSQSASVEIAEPCPSSSILEDLSVFVKGGARENRPPGGHHEKGCLEIVTRKKCRVRNKSYKFATLKTQRGFPLLHHYGGQTFKSFSQIFSRELSVRAGFWACFSTYGLYLAYPGFSDPMSHLWKSAENRLLEVKGLDSRSGLIIADHPRSKRILSLALPKNVP